MDQRVSEHAEVLVDWSARVEAGDDVVVRVDEGAHDLAVAVAEKLGERGANYLATYVSDEVESAFVRSHDGDFDDDPEFEVAMLENADVVLSLRAKRNTAAKGAVPGEKRAAYKKSRTEIKAQMMDTDWVSTMHPTRAHAQNAGMDYREYEDFVYDAVLRDWESLADEMARMKELLDEGSEVRLVKEDTDLTMSIEDRTAVNSAASVAYDSHNLPSGEVFTAPEDPEGEVYFDVPMTHDGTRIRDVHLTFDDGEVVDWSAETGQQALDDIFATDAGAKRLGELGIGMNRGIDRFTDSILFDEKMGDTVHLAVGRAYSSCLPEGEEGNQSAVHVDMITDVSEDSRMEIDGEAVQRNGRFRWEDGFEE
ncbi:aminopeptidase [Halorussus gelatinilyticus]|uniref:Aminopeptidase n=1 Tax=Halorussus gelatinilyticus TaxID=2937524 RepID=A0A8U0ILR1_9EURY|nr:aminopeptidase [Halorussus gelatinilyticus]UPW02083.1 aminopeptidase [Halorussus gelatinilyticus]